MKTLHTSIITVLAIGLQVVGAAAGEREFKANAAGIISFTDAPVHVAALAQQIKDTDMNRWLLSEDKNVRWMITKVTIVEDNLVLVDLSDGNGVESVLFDRSYDKKWSIIRRNPIGDAKPQNERRGDRLTVLPFPPPKAEQAGDGDAELAP